jgi:hypothetical protein
MKTIFRILVILTLAALVGGLFYSVVTATSSGANQTLVTERQVGEFNPRDREEDAGGIQFPVDVVKNLLIISIISVIYLNIARLLGRKKSNMPIAAQRQAAHLSKE